MLALISLLSFLLPTQLAIHLNYFQSTVYGFRIDYLIPTIYLTDIVALLIIILGIKQVKFDKKYLFLILAFLIFVTINILNSTFIFSSLYRWLKILEMLILGVVILKTKKFNIIDNFLIPLSLSVFVVTVLGILQYLFKGSLGGPFYFLGERTFKFLDPNIAPYPYSTFSHPNSYAGFLLIFETLFIQYKNSFNQKYFWTISSLVVANLLLTNSLNVYIAICALLIIGSFKRGLFFSFVGLDFGARYITHRIELISASLKMIKENFLVGVGLNNFIPNLVKVSNTFINSWELQPVHNIFLLIFAETGVVGFILFCILLLSTFSVGFSYPLFAILITGLSDHYWITLQQNILLLTYVLVITRIRKN